MQDMMLVPYQDIRDSFELAMRCAVGCPDDIIAEILTTVDDAVGNNLDAQPLSQLNADEPSDVVLDPSSTGIWLDLPECGVSLHIYRPFGMERRRVEVMPLPYTVEHPLQEIDV